MGGGVGRGNPTQETAPRQQDEGLCLRNWLQPAGLTHWQEEENAVGDDQGGAFAWWFGFPGA